jgi:hypothetical protein
VRHTTRINRDLLWWVFAVDAAVIAGEYPGVLLIGPGDYRGLRAAPPLELVGEMHPPHPHRNAGGRDHQTPTGSPTKT